MLPSGTSVGPYLIQSRINANGRAEVYLAIDRSSRNPVALKLWPASLIKDQNHREWFIEVFRAINQQRHPGICEIYQCGFTEDQHPFVAMEYLRGQSLDTPTIDDELSIAEIVSLIIPIADALEAVHKVGWLHLSIKPSNLMLTLSRQVKILDFGQGLAFPLSLAADLPPEAVRYLSPEQVLGKHPDQRADIFSLGAVFYELITGHPPFVGTTVDEAIASVELADPIPPMEFRDDLPTKVSRISEKAMAREVKNRYQTAGEFARDLRELGRTRPMISSSPVTVEERRVSGAGSKSVKKVAAFRWRAVIDVAKYVKHHFVSFRNALRFWISNVREHIPEWKREAGADAARRVVDHHERVLVRVVADEPELVVPHRIGPPEGGPEPLRPELLGLGRIGEIDLRHFVHLQKRETVPRAALEPVSVGSNRRRALRRSLRFGLRFRPEGPWRSADFGLSRPGRGCCDLLTRPAEQSSRPGGVCHLASTPVCTTVGHRRSRSPSRAP
ncbi:MAG: serine/threonine protein kinase [Acidobacteria bacterium]|nr:serine/threonine protein kinase [Acidobacteriota bacterium]